LSYLFSWQLAVCSLKLENLVYVDLCVLIDKQNGVKTSTPGFYNLQLFPLYPKGHKCFCAFAFALSFSAR